MQFLTTTSEGYISLFFTLALMLVLLYFMIYRPQKKQEKKDAAMRSSLEIGDGRVSDNPKEAQGSEYLNTFLYNQSFHGICHLCMPDSSGTDDADKESQ